MWRCLVCGNFNLAVSRVRLQPKSRIYVNENLFYPSNPSMQQVATAPAATAPMPPTKNNAPPKIIAKAATTQGCGILSTLRTFLAKLWPHRPRRECQYCCESKLEKAFNTNKRLPHGCHLHLRQVCKECIRTSLGAQLGTKPLLEIGCPQCAVPWDAEHIRVLLRPHDYKRFKQLDLLAKARAFVPIELPELSTMEEMLVHGTRFCPWCRFPFVKEGGCDFMTCTRCDKHFHIEYALVLEDGNGRRAADVSDDWDPEDPL